ncbi:class D sortase [Turicibacter sanguinis]|uniref:class D sortase n=1 Tax=Turicibacter sanguinis TaxID=154288 RepID=UPI00232B277B|nr:class D sortase [Turicibacter sanguinis]MDB8458648.1 class D sortase [Turicibacter sanguinis]
MKKIIPILLILIGVVCLGIGIYPLIEMNKGVKELVEQWEELKNTPKEETSNENVDQSIVGMMQIASFDKLLPIRVGTSDAILTKGVGIDDDTSMIGDVGNSVLYGHREEIFWNLKHVEVGELITIETLDNTLTYEIQDIQIVDPDDDWIYESSDRSMITLVTCYPFVYMGPTPERYVVKASLIE